jgi:hypothetical protein
LERARKDATGYIGVERVDDVLLADETGVTGIEQTKHSVDEDATFSDYSTAVWRTLGNWARLVVNGIIDLAKIEFVFVTNVGIPQGTALGHLLEGDEPRQPPAALGLFKAAAAASQSKTTEDDRADFLKLSDPQQEAFVAAVRVVTIAGLADLTSELQSTLHYICEPDQLPALASELEGWWLQRLSEHLGKGRGALVPLTELEARVSYLREKYKASNLPIDDEQPADDPESLAGYVFVHQLRVLHVGERRIRNAQRDFLRARAQRSKWVREARVDPAEMNGYDKSLCDLWRTRFAIMADEITSDTNEDDKRKAGRGLLGWAETQMIPLRGTQAQFLTSGSYQALADEIRVGWHPEFEGKFQTVKK